MADDEDVLIRVHNNGADEDMPAAQAFGWVEEWRDQLVETQEMVVHGLQLRLLGEVCGVTSGRGMANPKSGEIKDLAVALGIAMDKLDDLVRLTRGPDLRESSAFATAKGREVRG